MKEKIEKQIAEYERAKLNFIAQINACNGAIQALQKLLEEEKKPQEETPKKEGG